ncbi:MAG TPA: hypothetical protein VN721_04170 [Flavipsychrobacter sp.]|nr:hypothetical protein [Flavipsychrobacter sp.]
MNNLIARLETKNIFTSRLGFARAIMAISGLLTLLFNNIEDLTNVTLLDTPTAGSIFSHFYIARHYSVFEIFGPHWGQLISITILLFVMTGYFPKVSIFFQAWVHLSICNSFIILEGGDQVISNLCILLIPICLFDSRINQWTELSFEKINKRKYLNVFFNVYYFLIRIQVAIIYLHAATGKLGKESWLDGTGLYYWASSNMFGAPKYLETVSNYITLSSIVPIITWSVIIVELGLFACILATDKKIKNVFLFLGIVFHLAIMIIFGLVTFFFSMLAALVLYLDSDNLIYGYLRGVKYRLYAIKI